MTTSIEQAKVPEYIYLNLQNHAWRQHIKVAEGDRVLKGSLVIDGEYPLHASTSGTIEGIRLHPSSHRHANPTAHLVIRSDGLDEWCKKTRSRDPLTLSPEQLEQKIHISGISGLGGGGYPSASKLKTARSNTTQHLIINAIECEPEISTDEAIMLAAPTEILKAALATLRILALDHCILAIADDKVGAIGCFRSAIETLDLDEQVNLVTVKADFPNGSERQLIKILLGISLPRDTYPALHGIVCLNVSTLYAIYQAVYENRALVERVITLRTKHSVQNVRVHLGTPAGVLFDEVQSSNNPVQIRRGGPLTGWLQSPEASVDKGTTGLQLPAAKPTPKTLACIRCTKCADICPENLLPQELLWYSSPLNANKLTTLNLAACLECGLCESVCPSHIPLTNLFRDSKDSMQNSTRVNAHAQKASARVEKRQLRISNSGNKVQSQREKRMNRLIQKTPPHGEQNI